MSRLCGYYRFGAWKSLDRYHVWEALSQQRYLSVTGPGLYTRHRIVSDHWRPQLVVFDPPNVVAVQGGLATYAQVPPKPP